MVNEETGIPDETKHVVEIICLVYGIFMIIIAICSALHFFICKKVWSDKSTFKIQLLLVCLCNAFSYILQETDYEKVNGKCILISVLQAISMTAIPTLMTIHMFSTYHVIKPNSPGTLTLGYQFVLYGFNWIITLIFCVFYLISGTVITEAGDCRFAVGEPVSIINTIYVGLLVISSTICFFLIQKQMKDEIHKSVDMNQSSQINLILSQMKMYFICIDLYLIIKFISFMILHIESFTAIYVIDKLIEICGITILALVYVLGKQFFEIFVKNPQKERNIDTLNTIFELD